MLRPLRTLVIILLSFSLFRRLGGVFAFSTSKLEEPRQRRTTTTRDSTESVTWLLPPIAGLFGALSYESTRDRFHEVVDMASGNTWEAVDGGRTGGELLVPVLNGPVTLGVSILFGTLVAMTIQTLFSRQININQMLVLSMEEMRDLCLKVDAFSDPYKTLSNDMLRSFVAGVLEDVETGSVTTETLRSSGLAEFHLLLNDYSKTDEHPSSIVAEAFASLSRLTEYRSRLIVSLQTVFAPTHYLNIAALAMTLLTVFLLETDRDVLQFLVGFQLSLCWGLLIGTYSMLGVIMYDLSTPFSGVFRVLRPQDSSLERVFEYATAMDAIRKNK